MQVSGHNKLISAGSSSGCFVAFCDTNSSCFTGSGLRRFASMPKAAAFCVSLDKAALSFSGLFLFLSLLSDEAATPSALL